MLCADDTTVSASAMTIGLIIVSLRLPQECAANHASVVGLLIWVNQARRAARIYGAGIARCDSAQTRAHPRRHAQRRGDIRAGTSNTLLPLVDPLALIHCTPMLRLIVPIALPPVATLVLFAGGDGFNPAVPAQQLVRQQLVPQQPSPVQTISVTIFQHRWDALAEQAAAPPSIGLRPKTVEAS